MKRGTVKSPIQQPRSKEQLALEMKREQSRKLIKEKFYPALVSATKSVDEAGMLLQAVAALIMEEAMKVLQEKHMQEIKKRLAEKLCPNEDRLLQIEALLEVFDGMTLFETRGHFESMKSVLEQMKLEEFQGRDLSTLKPDWERYLTR